MLSVSQSSAASKAWLVAILALALALRLPGLTWGLPITPYSTYFHPDEGKIAHGAKAFPSDFLQRTDLRYPTGLHYGLGALTLPARILNTFLEREWIPMDRAHVALYGRLLNILQGVFSVFMAFVLGTKLRSKRVGLLSATFLAVSLYHARNSSFATTDVPLAMWLILVLYLTELAMEKITLRRMIIVGISFGILVGIKYTGGFAAVPVGVLVAQRLLTEPEPSRKRALLRYLFPAALAAVFSFLLTTPAILINFQAFWHSLTYEGARVSADQLPWWDLTVWTANYQQLAEATSPALAPLFAISLVYSLGNLFKARNLPYLAFLLAYFFYFTNRALPRYFIFALPIFALLAAQFASDLLTFTKARRLWRAAAVGLLIGILGYSLVYNLWGIGNIRNDPRYTAAIFIDEHLPRHATIGYGSIGNLERARLPVIDGHSFTLVDSLEFPEYVVLVGNIYPKIQAALESEHISAEYVFDSDHPIEITYYQHVVPDPEVLRLYDNLLNGVREPEDPAYTLLAEFLPDPRAPIEFVSPGVRIYQRAQGP